MASLRQISGRWYVRFRDANRRPKEKTVPLDPKLYPTESDRELRRMELEVAYRKGEWDPWTDDPRAIRARTPTVKESMDEYVRDKRQAGRRGERRGWNESTAANYETLFAHFARQLGPHRLVSDVTTSDLSGVIHQDELAQATRRMYRRALRTWTRWLARRGYVEGLNVPPALRKQKKIPAHIIEEELEMLCAAHVELCEETLDQKHYSGNNSRRWMQDVFRFAFYQPLRRAEIAELRPRHVDLSNGILRIGDADFQTKSGEERYVRITDPAFPIIERYVQDASKGDRVFRRTGRMFSDAFRAAAERAFPDRDDLHFHSLRHSGAIYWLKEGLRLIEVRDLLGHASTSTTERYLRALDNELRRRFGS